ncbi:MAG TPA: pilus assembly protein TadG-related protein [Candidatus Dormibacteraeota bacterium]|nr:pilus assembly protein TadG-related protein [Candidatus Dormibacteraeota bacterium]
MAGSALRAQKGQAIVLVALMLVVVVGMAALAIDGSRAYAMRRDLQAAVDAASLAAADNLQRTASYTSAEQAASASFGVNLRLYAAPSCSPGYGSPGASPYTVTCTYADGTVLVQSVQAQGPRGSMFQLTATRTLALQFGRIITNGTTPSISTTGSGRVNNLLYAPVVGALAQNGCGGVGGSAISINGTGTLSLVGDIVSSGTISVSSGAANVGGDIYARCQSSVSGATNSCYPSGAATPCTYPDVAGAVRTGYHYVNPQYPSPGPLGGSQSFSANNVVLQPGVYAALVNASGAKCYFLSGGVYDFQAGATNAGAQVSNELKPPDEPNPSNNSLLAALQFWNTTGSNCAGSVQLSTSPAAQGSGYGNCGQGQGNGQAVGCNSVPQGDWPIVITSTRSDTYNGVSYFRESAPSRCQIVHVDNQKIIKVIVSNVPGATAYNIYAALPGSGCNGPFGLAETLPVSVPVLNNLLTGCPAFSGTGCSLGFEQMFLQYDDLGSPFAPNAAAAPDTTGAYAPNSETAPLRAGLPNQNAGRLAGAAGDRANENNCESVAGAFASCPAAITPGAVVFYLPGASCLTTTNLSDTYLFSGYQYNWMAVYQPASNTCANTFGADQNSALIGLVYMPGGSLSIIDADTFDSAGTAGVIANTVSFSGTLPAMTYNAGYAPVPFASRLVA